MLRNGELPIDPSTIYCAGGEVTCDGKHTIREVCRAYMASIVSTF